MKTNDGQVPLYEIDRLAGGFRSSGPFWYLGQEPRFDMSMSGRSKLLLAMVFVVQFSFFGLVALHRFIDADEGSYLLASKLVLLHKMPYRDFFYNQAPLLPFIYAAWMRVTGVSWTSAKLFSALLTALLRTLVAWDVYRRTQKWVAGVSAILVFASSTMIFAWFPIVKTYSLAGLFLFAGYFVLAVMPDGSSRGRLIFAGLMLGFAVDTRSYLLLLLPVFLWWIFRNATSNDRRRSLTYFVTGFALGVLPSILLFLASPGAFLFNNLGYHSIRSSEGLVGWWSEKFVILLVLFLAGGEGNGLQWSILFFVSFGLALSGPKRNASLGLPLQLAAFLGLISLLPTPAYQQYFCLCVPFLTVIAVCMATEFLGGLESSNQRVMAAAACALLLAVYIAAGGNDLQRYLLTGRDVPGVKAAVDKADWTLPRVREVSGRIDRTAKPGEDVASFWPGDIFQAGADPVSGFENPFALPISGKLTPEQRRKYHILSTQEILDNFAAHKWPVVVLRNQIISPFTDQHHTNIWDDGGIFRSSLLANGYRVDHSIGGISIYVCCGK